MIKAFALGPCYAAVADNPTNPLEQPTIKILGMNSQVILCGEASLKELATAIEFALQTEQPKE